MAELITVAEIQTWDEFPIQLVTSVCQLSTFNRCTNVVTTLSRQAPLFAFGTAAGEIAIMQVAPCRVTDQVNENHNSINNNSDSQNNSNSNNNVNTSSSNQRSKNRERRDALRASAKVDRIGFFSLPQPSLPLSGNTMAFPHRGEGGSTTSPVTSSPSFLANNNNTGGNIEVIPPTAARFSQSNSSGASSGSWAVTQMAYSPFSNTIFCLCGGAIYILELIADDSSAVSTISGNTENRFLRCAIVGQVPSPSQARGETHNNNYASSSYMNTTANFGPSAAPTAAPTTANFSREGLNSNSNFESSNPNLGAVASATEAGFQNNNINNNNHHNKNLKNNSWLHFTIHSSLTEVRLAVFALNQVSCFVVDTKPLAIAKNLNAAASSPYSNPEHFLQTGRFVTPPHSHRSQPNSGRTRSHFLSNGSNYNNNNQYSQAFVEINPINTFSVRHNFLSSIPSNSGSAAAAHFFHNHICATWCGPLLVCNSANSYNFFAPELSNPVRVISATKETKIGSVMTTSIFREKANTISLKCVSLHDSFRINDDDFSEESPGVAMLITEVADGGKAADVALPFYVQIWMYQSGGAGNSDSSHRHHNNNNNNDGAAVNSNSKISGIGNNLFLHREIPCLFSMTRGVHLASTGPWLLVASSDGGGIDVHNWQTGTHIQSCAEEFANDFSINQSLSSLFSRSCAVVQPLGKQIMWKQQETKNSVQELLSQLYVERSIDVVIGGTGKLLILQFESPRAVLTHYAKAQTIEGYEEEQKNAEMMALQHFAISVGNRGSLFSDDLTSVGKIVQKIPDGFDDLLQSFAHVTENFDSSNNNNNNNNNQAKVCFNCKQSFGFLSKRHFLCTCCLRHFCEKCAPVRDASELIRRGVMRHSVRICNSCFVRVDENMFNLLSNGKYREALHYLVSSRMMEARNQYPEIYGELANISFAGQTIRLDDVREFHLPHLGTPQIDEILWRCIKQGKLALCAQLLPMACGTDEERWQQFVMYFLTDADAAMSLANNIPHHQLQTQIGKFVYSSILIALVKYSPILLTQTLGKWPANFYSAQLVTSAIESSLKSKLEQATTVQRECQMGGAPVIWESPWNWKSIGELYIDDDVKTLVSAFLMLCKKKRMYIDALKMHLNFFEKFLPHMNGLVDSLGRDRGGTVFEKAVLVYLNQYHQHHQRQSSGGGGGGNNGFENNELFPQTLLQTSSSSNPSSPASATNASKNATPAKKSTTTTTFTDYPPPGSARGAGGGTFHQRVPSQTMSNPASATNSRPDTGRNNFKSSSNVHPMNNNNNNNNNSNNFISAATPRSQNSSSSQHPIFQIEDSNNNNNNHFSSKTVTRLIQFQSSTRQRCQRFSVAAKFSPLINTFEWILNYNLTDVLLRPGERIGGGGGSRNNNNNNNREGSPITMTSSSSSSSCHYDGPSLLPLILQIWRLDSIKFLLQWPELTSRPDVVDSLVQQICETFNVGKDGLVIQKSNINNSSPTSTTGTKQGNFGDNNNNNSKSVNLQTLIGSGGKEYSKNNNSISSSSSTSTSTSTKREIAPVPPVGQENDGPMILQALLHEITTLDVGATMKHHNLLACLYVHHAPHRLLNFLRDSTVTSLDYAKLSQLVRQKRMFGELAYIMGRSGDASEAIRLVVRCLRDVEFAIQFVEDTDEQLWDELIKHVLQSPLLIGSFLDHAIGHFDMAKFLKQIPDGNRLRVPNASRRLGRVIVEQAIDTSLNQTSLDSYNTENYNLHKEHFQKARGAVRFTSSSLSSCNACGIGIDLYGVDAANASVVFNSVGCDPSTTTTENVEDSSASIKNSNNKGSKTSTNGNNTSINGTNKNNNNNNNNGNKGRHGNNLDLFSLTSSSQCSQKLFHPGCAEPQCGGTIPSVSYESSRLMMREKQRKRAAKLENDAAHLNASLEVYRDSENYDICETLPRPLRFAIFSYLGFSALDAARLVSHAWYLHIRAFECGLHLLLYNGNMFDALKDANRKNSRKRRRQLINLENLYDDEEGGEGRDEAEDDEVVEDDENKIQYEEIDVSLDEINRIENTKASDDDDDDDDLSFHNKKKKSKNTNNSNNNNMVRIKRRKYKYKKEYDLVYGVCLEHRTVFQRYQWVHGTFPARRPPFGSYDEGGNGDEDDNVFSSTFGLRIGGHGAMSDRLNRPMRSDELLVPVGNDCFYSRNL